MILDYLNRIGLKNHQPLKIPTRLRCRTFGLTDRLKRAIVTVNDELGK